MPSSAKVMRLIDTSAGRLANCRAAAQPRTMPLDRRLLSAFFLSDAPVCVENQQLKILISSTIV
jgi:hypothetical protein